MSIDKENLQHLNALFAFLSHIESVVLWICTPDYSRQLYVNENYDHIWGRSREILLTEEGFKTWKDSLIVDDLQHNLTEFYRRSDTPGASGMLYRVHTPSGHLNFMKDISYTLVDLEGKPSAIIGVAEMISQERWGDYYLTDHIPLPKEHIVKDCINILKKEYHLLPSVTARVDKFSVIPEYLMLTGESVYLNRRQRECLYYLLQGYTAKKTAAEMCISPRTVETYIDQLKIKFKCSSKLSLLSKLKVLL